MFEKGECFDLNGTIIEIEETYTHPQGEDMYKVKYYDRGSIKYDKEGFISETLLKCLPTFPF